MENTVDKSLKDQILEKMIETLKSNNKFDEASLLKLASIKFDDLKAVKGALEPISDENKEA